MLERGGPAMTEAQWLAGDDPAGVPAGLRGRVSDRTARLFACACCRAAWHLLPDERSRGAVEAAERLADGPLTDDERRAAVLAAGGALERSTGACFRAATAAWLTLTYGGDRGGEAARAWSVAGEVRAGLRLAVWEDVADEVLAAQVRLARCIFGNPFRPVSVDPSWLTSTVVTLAAGIYADRAFDRLPIFADALQDAGCDNADVLDHCRGPGPHVRGCWVLDLVLGKS
jgi:hypothetical protein